MQLRRCCWIAGPLMVSLFACTGTEPFAPAPRAFHLSPASHAAVSSNGEPIIYADGDTVYMLQAQYNRVVVSTGGTIQGAIVLDHGDQLAQAINIFRNAVVDGEDYVEQMLNNHPPPADT